jgi:cation:H+ antiporter
VLDDRHCHCLVPARPAVAGAGRDSIVKAVSGLAQRFGASPFTAGLLLLGVTTSLPELAVNARALAVGQPELALGNAVGSSIVNLGLTLAVAAIAAPCCCARLRTVLWWSLLAGCAADPVRAGWRPGALGRRRAGGGFIVMQVLLLRARPREVPRCRQPSPSPP